MARPSTSASVNDFTRPYSITPLTLCVPQTRFSRACTCRLGTRTTCPTSRKRFADGGQYRIEIPSCEGPRAMEAGPRRRREHAVSIHRVSQGSGVMLQTDDEIRRMLALGRRTRHRSLPLCRSQGQLGRRAFRRRALQGESSAPRSAASTSSSTASRTCGTRSSSDSAPCWSPTWAS